MLKRFSNPTVAVVERLRPNTPGSDAFRSRSDATTTVVVQGAPDEHWRAIPVTRMPKDAVVTFSPNYKGCRRMPEGRALGTSRRISSGGLGAAIGTKGWGDEYRADRNHRINTRTK